MPSKVRKPPGYRRCGEMVYSDAKRALLMAKSIKSLMNVEFKNHDVKLTASALAVAPIISQLTNIAIGDTTNTRDGSSIKLVSILFKYLINMNASATQTKVRVVLIHDRQTNEAVYSAADFLEDVTAGDSIVAARNLDNGHRFQVLYDKVHTYSISGRQNSYHQFYKKLNLKLRYDNAAAAITSLTQSSLSLLTTTNEATNVPNITSIVRLRYVDN